MTEAMIVVGTRSSGSLEKREEEEEDRRFWAIRRKRCR